MWQKNKGQKEDEILQNHFTAYVVTAVRRRREEYTRHFWDRLELEYLTAEIGEAQGYDPEQKFDLEQEVVEGLPLFWRLENDALLHALKELSQRERHVFLSRVLDEKSFEELAEELHLGYKGVAAIYYRTIPKIKKRMGERE